MRRFQDRQGRTWDVVVGRESFGALYAIFVPAAGNPADPLQTMLRAESPQAAQEELERLSQAQLEELLERSDPKTME